MKNHPNLFNFEVRKEVHHFKSLYINHLMNVFVN